MCDKKTNTKDKTEAIMKLLMRRGVIGDSQIDDTHMREVQRKKKQDTFHNTMSLLKHYRTITWMLECFPETIASELNQSFERFDDLVGRLDVEMAMGNQKVESRLENIKKTRLVLDRVNEALTVLKRKPEDGERLYEIIYLTYIAPEALSHNELLYRLNLSSRHYYRLRELGISIISLRLWSAPDREVDFWLDLLAAMEE